MGTKDNKTLGFFILINIVMAIGLVVLGVLYQNLNHKLEQIQHGAPENHKVSKRHMEYDSNSEDGDDIQCVSPSIRRCQRGRNCRCYTDQQFRDVQQDNQGTVRNTPQSYSTGAPTIYIPTPQPAARGGNHRSDWIGQQGQAGGSNSNSFDARFPGSSFGHPVFGSGTAPGGSAFVSWGNFRCPQDSERLYRGFVAGPLPQESVGGGSDLQCLPQSPDSINTPNDNNSVSSLRSNAFISPVKFDKTFLNLTDTTINCAVCHLAGKAQVMIPGLRDCPNNWSKQYEGWLMGDSGTQGTQVAVNHICMNKNPITTPGHTGTQAIKLSHVQFYSCPSQGLPCENYSRFQKLPCVVCSK